MYKDKLSKVLHTNLIKDNNIDYYYTKFPEWCREYDVNPMFDDILPFKYYIPLQYLNYPKYMIELAKKYSGSMIQDVSEDIDQIILEYIKCRPKTLLLTVWYEVTQSNLLKYLNERGNVYYIKYIKLSSKSAESLIYQLYADTGLYKDIDSIKDMLKTVYKFEGGYITVIVFDNIKSEHHELIKLNINQIIVKKGCFHLNTRYYKTVENGQIYFCKNSLKFLENQLLQRHIDIRMRKSRILLATFKRWFAQNVSLKDRRGFLILSGSILYSYGMRNIHDIDMYIDGSCYTTQVERYLVDPLSKFYFMDVGMRGTHTWRQYWDKWGIKWAQLMGANNFDEIVYNPEYHYYYMGMKFLCLEGDIQKRLIRQRPRSLVDLIKINQLLGYKIQIPSIPITQKKYIPLNENIDIESLENNQKYNPNNNEIECVVRVDFDRFLSTMQWYLKVVYHEEHSINDIKPLVGIRKIRVKKS